MTTLYPELMQKVASLPRAVAKGGGGHIGELMRKVLSRGRARAARGGSPDIYSKLKHVKSTPLQREMFGGAHDKKKLVGWLKFERTQPRSFKLRNRPAMLDTSRPMRDYKSRDLAKRRPLAGLVEQEKKLLA